VVDVWSSVRGTGRTPRVNGGYSLPTRVDPQVARLGLRALVAQGMEQRFPKPLRQGRAQGAGLLLLLLPATKAGRKPWLVCSLVPLPPDALELGGPVCVWSPGGTLLGWSSASAWSRLGSLTYAGPNVL
jgi:hypothetical protein